MAATIGAISSAWMLGLLVVAALWPMGRRLRDDAALILPLGIGTGFGVTSVLFFVTSLCVARPAVVSAACELALGGALGWFVWRRRRGAVREAGGVRRAFTGWELLAISILAQTVFVSAVVAWRAWLAEPHGGWDGWAIWNMRARFIFRGGAEWTDVLRAQQIGWSHLDYPLLVPASVARVWAWRGADDAIGSGLVSLLFGGATVVLLVAVAARLRSVTIAAAGGLVLLGTPFFVTFSANAHADIPLGFFVLATLALVALSGRSPEARGLPALAGIAAGLAAWTKNEGLLFVAAVAFGWGAVAWVRGERRGAGVFFAALAGALAPVIFFKLAFAPGNDLVSGALADRMAQLWDPARHARIWAAVWRDATGFGEWRVVPFAAMALVLATPGARRLLRREGSVALVPGIVLVGYYVVYLLTHWDLATHLDTSLVRLFVQLWPAVVLLWCMLAAVPEPPTALGQQTRRRGAMAAVGLANLIAFGCVGWWLGAQKAPHELAAARIGGGALSVVAGEGWFAGERHGRDAWRWSKGDATIRLHAHAPRGSVPATLRFGLRSLAPRTVTVKTGDRLLWRGPVGETFAAVSIAGLALSPGETELMFSSEEPAVEESAQPGARALGFALYNLHVE